MPLYRGFGRGAPPSPPDDGKTRRIARPGAGPASPDAAPTAEAPVPAPEGRSVAGLTPAFEPTRRVVRNEAGRVVRKDTVPATAEAVPVAVDRETVPETAPPLARLPSRDPLANPVVGWLAITAGPGRGEILPLSYGVNDIGRGSKARICLNFGDPAIASDNQAAIIYTARSRRFYLQSVAAGICLNGRTVRDSVELSGGETLQLGQTELRFVPLCGLSFDWRDGK